MAAALPLSFTAAAVGGIGRGSVPFGLGRAVPGADGIRYGLCAAGTRSRPAHAPVAFPPEVWPPLAEAARFRRRLPWRRFFSWAACSARRSAGPAGPSHPAPVRRVGVLLRDPAPPAGAATAAASPASVTASDGAAAARPRARPSSSLVEGELEPQALAGLGEVLAPAAGVVRRVGGQQQHPGVPGAGHGLYRLLAHGQPAAPQAEAQQGQNVESGPSAPRSSASMAS